MMNPLTRKNATTPKRPMLTYWCVAQLIDGHSVSPVCWSSTANAAMPRTKSRKPEPVLGRHLRYGFSLRGPRSAGRELGDGPAVALVDLLDRRPRLHPLHHAALHDERLAADRAVGGGEVGDERRDVGRVPDVERAGIVGRLHRVAEPGRLEREPGAGAGRDRVAAHAVAHELLRAHLREGRDPRLGAVVVGLARGC